MRVAPILAFLLLAAACLNAQQCPAEGGKTAGVAVKPSVLHGTLVAHDDLRHWLGLKLDEPACGQTEIQIVFSKAEQSRAAETLRQCTVTATGALYESPTGYYSTAVAMSDAQLKPDESCRPLPVEPDSTAVLMPSNVMTYSASIRIDFRGRGHIDVAVNTNREKPVDLTPWQAYVSYTLNGSGDVIWFACQKDFQVKDFTQSPSSRDGVLNDEPELTGATLQDAQGVNVITFQCQRKNRAVGQKKSSTQAKPNP